MSIPIIVFLFVYLMFVLIWLVFSIIGLYHMLKFGQASFFSLLATFAYLAYSITIVYLSSQYIVGVDWWIRLEFFSDGISIFESSGF